MTARRQAWLAAVVGIVSAAVVLGVAEICALFTGIPGSPLFAVGSLGTARAPRGPKVLMIALSGTGERAPPLPLPGITTGPGPAAAGWLDLRKPPIGTIVFGIAGFVAIIAVISRTGAAGIDGVPTVV